MGERRFCSHRELFKTDVYDDTLDDTEVLIEDPQMGSIMSDGSSVSVWTEEEDPK